MRCPRCEGKVKVVDVVNTHRNEVYRRRECQECKYVFYTTEYATYADEYYLEDWYKNYRK